MGTRKIEAWHKAGVIDAATRDRLIAHEAAHARPIALWAVFGIGALAIGLGLVSVVAANWEDIPGGLRLGVHLTLIAAGVATLATRPQRLAALPPFAEEALLFVIGALGLTFFGHLGQVYQTASPLWQALALWLVLFAPLLLLMGRGLTVASAVMGVLIWALWDYAGHHAAVSGTALALWLALVTALPVVAAPLGGWLRQTSARPDFWRRVEQLGLAYAVAGAALASVLASTNALDDKAALSGFAAMGLRAAIGCGAGLALMAARPGMSGRMAGAIIAGAGLVVLLAVPLNGLDFLPALLFMALWTGIAAAALKAGWRGVFQLAVGMVALRLIIVSFELASDLLLSGFGLIIAGLLILGIGWAALKVSRTYAPESEDGA
ncbi:DUF2157 domain-containing protein [Erythrobacter sp. T5W1-R]|uniref:DUF2157 domain-containing protein n=1 Tax=Erythrobacter sp. T5W1-R TaxID=3101752 RepID=UPI002B001297|nr:DUF2157 domain-containing protein [Erythrobacter sp. T5W1-R]MEA1618942.1 DUF2157 domain-containing protein [Erythrobacter sp. T5W1-R]